MPSSVWQVQAEHAKAKRTELQKTSPRWLILFYFYTKERQMRIAESLKASLDAAKQAAAAEVWDSQRTLGARLSTEEQSFVRQWKRAKWKEICKGSARHVGFWTAILNSKWNGRKLPCGDIYDVFIGACSPHKHTFTTLGSLAVASTGLEELVDLAEEAAQQDRLGEEFCKAKSERCGRKHRLLLWKQLWVNKEHRSRMVLRRLFCFSTFFGLHCLHPSYYLACGGFSVASRPFLL